ncbi:hypothetical protein CEP53_015024 [Fusarium sp. AF-6]|nr:hypothetical protein CEP53_015024 [Fusarium sp. AF-6]
MPTRLDRCKAACPDADLMEDVTQGLRSLQHMAVPSSRYSMGSIGSRVVTVDYIHRNLRFTRYPRSLPSLKPPKIKATATACAAHRMHLPGCAPRVTCRQGSTVPWLLTVNGKLRHHSSRGFADGGVSESISTSHSYGTMNSSGLALPVCLPRLLIDEDPLPRGFLDPSGKA